ncbi:MAG: clostripain-related cysteine peptidase [Candidatus Thorarchaeota archaeon]
MKTRSIPFWFLISLLFSQIIFSANVFELQSNSTPFEDISEFTTHPISKIPFIELESNHNEKSSKVFPNASNKNWTYMVYLDGDNDLEEYAIEDIDEMERAGGSTDDINYIVLLDRIPGYDSSNGDWTDARIYEISDDETSDIDSNLQADLGELEMDNPTTLRNFIEYCFNNYPADYYCLTLWDHGNGIFGTCYDDSTSSTAALTINEIQTAITLATATYNETIDILALDCCEMGMMEIAYEFRNCCNYFIASEGIIPFDGFPYEKIIHYMNLNPSIKPFDLCHVIINSFKDRYTKTSLTCLSALNISKMDYIIPIVSDFVDCLEILISDKNCEYLYYISRLAAQTFLDGSAVDLIQFLGKIKYYIPTSELSQIASELLLALEDIIITNYQHSSYYTNANGLSIFLPSNSYYISIETIEAYTSISDAFQNIDWLSETEWDEFILFLLNTFNLEEPDIPELLTLRTNTEEVMISKDYFKEYYVYIPKSGIYEFNCFVVFGDVDFRIAVKDDNIYKFIAKSSLFNPNDATTEVCRMYFASGIYYLFIQGQADSSSYLLNALSYTIPEIETNKQYQISGGSMYGEEDGHFKQDLRHYYLMDLRKDSYTIFLNNTDDANYQISIYDEEWNLLKRKIPSGLLNDLTIEFNITDSSIYYIEVYSLFGSGECILEIRAERSNNLGNSFIFSSLIVLLIFSILGFSKKKFQK